MLRNLLRSAGAISIGHLLNIAGTLALVPLFLVCWNNAVYGDWMVLSSAVAYLSTLDMGLNAAGSNALVAAFARRNLPEYRAIQSSTLGFYVALACVVTIVTGVACLVVPLSSWLGVKHIPPGSVPWIAWILTARLIWQMPAAQVWNIYRTTGDQATTQWIWNLQFGGTLAATCLVLWLGGSPRAMAAWPSVPIVLVSAGSWLALKRTHPSLLPHFDQVHMSRVLGLLRPSLYFGVITIALALALNGPVIAISRVAGGTVVTLLITTRTLTNVVRQAQGILTTALWPHLTRMHAVGDHGSLKTAYRLLIGVSMAISVGFAAALWFEGTTLIAAWTRGRLLCDATLLHLLLIATVLQALYNASSMVPIATNQHKNVAKAFLGSAVLSTAGTVVLAPHLGVAAAGWAILIGDAVYCYHFVIRNGCSSVGEAYPRFAGQFWMSLSIVSALTGIAGWSAHRFGIGELPLRWIETGIVTFTTSLSAVWLVFLDADTRRGIVSEYQVKMAGLLDRVRRRNHPRGSPVPGIHTGLSTSDLPY